MRRTRKDEADISPHTCRFLARCCLALIGIFLLWGLVYMPMKAGTNMHLPSSLSWMIAQRDLALIVHPDNDTLLLQPDLPENKSLYLIVVVCSAVPNFQARQAIRKTWANWTTEDVRVLFLLGTSSNQSLNSVVEQESLKNQDIIQQNFLDTYNNLTVKSAMLLKWIDQNAPQVKYVMKTDDDMFVNLPNLIKLLKRKGHSKLLLGCLIQGATPVKDWSSKWFVPDMIFTERTYPPYLSGTGYVMSSDIVPTLLEIALNTPFFYLEDIFITGVCARRAGIKPINNEGFKFYKRKNNTCIFRSLITAHKMTVKEQYDIWRKLHDPSLKCKS